MPIYCYVCPECGSREEVLTSLDGCKERACGCKVPQPIMKRDFQAERPNALGTEKGDTFWSQSLAINPSQTAEHRRLFPDVRVRPDGCLGFDSVASRERYCEQTGFVKQPGKLKGPSKHLTPAKTRAT